MYPLIRDIHAYLGLALAALLTVYVWTGFEIVHGGERAAREIAQFEVGVEPVGAANADPALVKAAVRSAAASVGVADGAVVRLRFEKGAWSAHVRRTRHIAEVRLAPGSPRAQVALLEFNRRAAVVQFHRVTSTDARNARFGWVIAIDALSIGLIAFSVTGLLMFLSLKRKRRLGWTLLGVSTLYTLASIAHLMIVVP